MANANAAGVKNIGDNGPDGMGLNGRVLLSSIETIVAGGTSTVLDRDFSVHFIDADAGGDIFTLADGDEGEVAEIYCASATGICTVTPANLSGGTSVTLNADGESVKLRFVSSSWRINGGNAFTVI